MVLLQGEDKQAMNNSFLHGFFIGSQEAEGVAQPEVCPPDSRYGLKVCPSGLEIRVYVFPPPSVSVKCCTYFKLSRNISLSRALCLGL